MRNSTGLANVRILALLTFLAAAVAMTPYHRAVPRRADSNPQAKLHLPVYMVDPPAEAAALSWAERLLTGAPERLPRSEDDGPLAWKARGARGAFSHIIAKYGPSARAELGLGKCCLRLGLYGDAVAAFSRALSFHPAARDAGSYLRDARLLWQVSRKVQPLLPRGSTVLRVRAYPEPVPGRSWLVLSGFVNPSAGMIPGEPLHHTIVLSLFSTDGANYRRVWRSKPITGFYREASYDVWAVDLIVEFLHSGAVPQVLVYEGYPGGDSDPEHVSVWAWDHGALTTAGSLDSIDGMSEGRIERGGQRAIFITNRIDSSTCEAEKPRWTDAYTWRHGRLKPCDGWRPDMVRESMRQLRGTLKDHPGDVASLRYLGAAYDLLGLRHRALACYRASRKGLHPDTDPAGDLADLGDIYDIAGRPARAIRAYRAAERQFLHEIPRTKDPDERSWMENDLASVRQRLAARARVTKAYN